MQPVVTQHQRCTWCISTKFLKCSMIMNPLHIMSWIEFNVPVQTTPHSVHMWSTRPARLNHIKNIMLRVGFFFPFFSLHIISHTHTHHCRDKVNIDRWVLALELMQAERDGGGIRVCDCSTGTKRKITCLPSFLFNYTHTRTRTHSSSTIKAQPPRPLSVCI